MLSEVSSIDITDWRRLLTFLVDFLLNIPELFIIFFGINEDSLGIVLISCFSIRGLMSYIVSMSFYIVINIVSHSLVFAKYN